MPRGADPLSIQAPGPPRARGAARAPEMSVPASDSTALTGQASCLLAPCLLQCQNVNSDVPLSCHPALSANLYVSEESRAKAFPTQLPPSLDQTDPL